MKIMVLTDGESFSGLDGCVIYDVPDGFETEDIEQLLADITNDESTDQLKVEAMFWNVGDEWGQTEKAIQPCIERTYFGGKELVSFTDFAEKVVQDYLTATAIARTMLDGEAPYDYNYGDRPDFFERFEIHDGAILAAALKELESKPA